MALEQDVAARVIAAVEAGFVDQLEFTKSLIRFPSTRGNEHPIQDFVFRALRERGYAMDRFAMDRDAISRHVGGSPISTDHSTAPIVVGIHRPRHESGRSLILQAHVDVVPTGPSDMWSHPPFEPVVTGDWLFGRGGADMKAGHAANIFALDALRRTGVPAEVAAQEIRERIAAFSRNHPLLANNRPLVTFNGFFAEGYVLEPGTGAEAVLAAAHERATGAPLETMMTAGYLDARVYALYDRIPALCYGPISRNIHAIDECVSINSVKRITTAMALFIAEWCGLEAVDTASGSAAPASAATVC